MRTRPRPPWFVVAVLLALAAPMQPSATANTITVEPLGVPPEACIAPTGTIGATRIGVHVLCDLQRFGALDRPIDAPLGLNAKARAGSFPTTLRLQQLAAAQDSLDPLRAADLFSALLSGDLATFDAAIPELLRARPERDRSDALSSTLLGSSENAPHYAAGVASGIGQLHFPSLPQPIPNVATLGEGLVPFITGGDGVLWTSDDLPQFGFPGLTTILAPAIYGGTWSVDEQTADVPSRS